MNLLETYDNLLHDWLKVFSQKRTFGRARRLTFGLLVCLRLHLTSRAICAVGRQSSIGAPITVSARAVLGTRSNSSIRSWTACLLFWLRPLRR